MIRNLSANVAERWARSISRIASLSARMVSKRR